MLLKKMLFAWCVHVFHMRSSKHKTCQQEHAFVLFSHAFSKRVQGYFQNNLEAIFQITLRITLKID